MEWVRGDSIGCGSFSTVNLATPTKAFSGFPPLMAVKSCNDGHSSLLENEFSILSEIGCCPQIIQCFGDYHTIENHENLYNLLLEYAPGGSLTHHLKKSGGFLQESQVKDYTRSILNGLFHIHAKGFVHCDIKLENILLCDNGEAKIADFGLAKKAGQKQGRLEVRGTPLYMSPESVNDNEYEPPCDIWALGCAVVEMVTGTPAWNVKPGSNMYALLIRIGVGDELPRIPEALSKEGKDFLSKCFVKDPAKRWTAEMLLNHPFVASNDDGLITLKDDRQGLSASPRCPFDFSYWISIKSSSNSELWSDREVNSRFDSLFSSCSSSPADRIRQLVSDQSCNWSNSGSWITIR